jgi:flagellar M-ring protein FliF
MNALLLWNGLGTRQRLGLVLALLAILLGSVAAGAWLLRDPLVPMAGELDAEHVAALSQALERERVAYHVADDGRGIAVPRSQLGKARAAAGGGLALPPSVGLEMFKDTDFSTTDFAQRINYQRALQGELTRTIQGLSGVRSARVHVILPETGLLRRSSIRASAAVGVAMREGRVLSSAQVRGIQRLVAASVPDMRPEEVAVFDAAGASLSAAPAGEGEASSAQLALKRQVDGYLEAKLARLLDEVVPGGSVGLAVDATLDERQLRVTTEEPLAVAAKDAERPAGVLSRERQVDHGAPAASAEAAGGAERSEWEFEYRVGQRVEQTLAAAGSIRRLSVAVAVRGGPAELRAAAIEQLVAHAVGLDRGRGDAVTVMLLPAPAHEVAGAGQAAQATVSAAVPVGAAGFAALAGSAEGPAVGGGAADAPAASTGGTAASASAAAAARVGRPSLEPPLLASLAGLACALLLPLALRRRARRSRPKDEPDAEAMARRVRHWLEGEGRDADR